MEDQLEQRHRLTHGRRRALDRGIGQPITRPIGEEKIVAVGDTPEACQLPGRHDPAPPRLGKGRVLRLIRHAPRDRMVRREVFRQRTERRVAVEK